MSRSSTRRRGKPKSIKCSYMPCKCTVEKENSYCSEYCEQAAALGAEREYCQCEHECAPPRLTPAAAFDSGPTKHQMVESKVPEG
jgi:hypothetical protein